MDETRRTKQWQIGDEIVGNEASVSKQAYIMWELREEQFNLIVDLLKSINKSIKDLESVIELLKPRSEE